MIKQDKIEHWAFGFVLTLFALVDPHLIFLGYAFGVTKEVYDHYWGTGFDLHDMLATFIGSGMALVLLAHLGVFSWGMIF